MPFEEKPLRARPLLNSGGGGAQTNTLGADLVTPEL